MAAFFLVFELALYLNQSLKIHLLAVDQFHPVYFLKTVQERPDLLNMRYPHVKKSLSSNLWLPFCPSNKADNFRSVYNRALLTRLVKGCMYIIYHLGKSF